MAHSSFKQQAFTLLEVMIASGIFFVASFAILALVSQNLRNARVLQRPPVDAGLVASEYVSTNRFTEGSKSGHFEDKALQEYSWNVETTQVGTNGLLGADISLSRRGLKSTFDELKIIVFDPNFGTRPR